MSKIKMSFSLIFAFFLVGILSTAVFANSNDGLAAKTDGNGGFTVSFGGSSASTSFTVQFYDSQGNTVGQAATGKTGTSPQSYGAHLYTGSVTVDPTVDPTATFQPGTAYTVKLYAGTDTTGTALDSTTARILDSNVGPNNAPKTNASPNGGLLNSNLTGVNDPHKTRSTDKMHGFYQNNTNSCASCHQTHTANVSATDTALLFKDGVYSTCTTCHDGTTGGYNAFTPPTPDTPNSVGGTFGIVQTDSTTKVNENGSMHQADGSMQISAAPGGGGSQAANTTSTYTSTWGSEFDCASCHNPHGGGSTLNGTKNENNLNEDPLGWGTLKYVSANAGGSQDAQHGKLFQGRNIYPSVPTSWANGNYDTYILVQTTPGTVLGSSANIAKTNNKTNGYLYGAAGITDTSTPIIQTYRWNGSKYTPDFSLWLRGSSGVFGSANTVLYNATGGDITSGAASNITAVFANGFAFGTGVSAVSTYDLSVGINVENASEDVATYYDNTASGYVPYSGAEMSQFCASCHTDYLSSSPQNVTGVYATAHRHQTDSDSYTCVRCHFAHGSDAQIMKDANDNSYWNLTTGTSPNGVTVNTLTPTQALSYLADPNPSSALKRYTGMSVCYSCHGGWETLLSDPNTTGDTTTGQTLFGGKPGVEGSSTGAVAGTTRTNLVTRH